MQFGRRVYYGAAICYAMVLKQAHAEPIYL